MEEAITTIISPRAKIVPVKKPDKPQASNNTVDTTKSNKTETAKSLYKMRSTQRTDTENTVDKPRSIPRSKYFNKITRIDKPSEIHIHKDNLSIYILSGQGESLSSVTSDTLPIPRKNKRNETPDISIIRKETIQEPFNTRKKAKENTLTDVEKSSPSVNYLFERKQMIDDLEAELTGSLTKIG